MGLCDSFSRIHTTAYSIIAIQEMNLAYFYPILYWNAACLSVDCSAVNQGDFYNLLDEGIIDDEDVEGKKIQNKMDYAKVASALDSFKRTCDIELPDINLSRLGFTPDVTDNSILYGLKGITRVTEPVINAIVAARPYSSLQDFLNKRTARVITKDKIVNLIKCGAFNRIEHKSTREILTEFIKGECDQKKRLTMQNANMLIDYNLLPQSLSYECECYKLTKELRRHRDEEKLWYIGDNLEIPESKYDIWKQIIVDSGIQGMSLNINGETHRVIDSGEWDHFYQREMTKISVYIKAHHDELLKKLNDTLFTEEFNKYCAGDELQWELDSLNFFFSGHPLEKVLPQLPFDTSALDNIVEGAQAGTFVIKGKIVPKMELYTIAGTVIDKDKTKGVVTLQCVDGVVNLKVYKDLFATFNSDSEDQTSFFEKGTHLLVTGIKRGPTFVPKVYKSTGRKAILRINLDENGNFKNLEEKKEVVNANE